MQNELLQLYKDIKKMVSDLDYDKREMDRLRSDIEYTLEVDVIECNRKTLIDRLLRLSLIRSENASKKFRKRKFKHIREALELGDDKYLINTVYNESSIFELRQNTADGRYNLRELLYTPSSHLIIGTILHDFYFRYEQITELENITYEIKGYLEHKYSSQITLIK